MGTVVYLLVGQRGSGKSYYAKRTMENQSGLTIVSRDEILVRLFGSANLGAYGGEHFFAGKVMHRLLRRKLSSQTDVRLILDTWTGDSIERERLVAKLRQYGANRVVALYFTTPLDTVNAWFWKKPGIARISEMNEKRGQGLVFFSEDAPAHDHKVFHILASDINSNGFDQVVRVDPRGELITLV